MLESAIGSQGSVTAALTKSPESPKHQKVGIPSLAFMAARKAFAGPCERVEI